MRNVVACICLILLTSQTFAQSFNQWIPLKQLVLDSDLIVAGTLRSVSKYTKHGVDYSEGIIVVDEFISGNIKTARNQMLKPGDRIKLKWSDPSEKISDRVELGGSENNEVIWILRVVSDGTVTADHFVCYRAISEADRIKRILQQAELRKPVKNVELYEEDDFSSGSQSIQKNEHSILSASIVTAIMVALYWALYRSRLKIGKSV